MEIRELRAFAAVAEEGGLSAAARRLHVSQSALSQTVKSLERQLRVTLLERDHTGARPASARAVALITGAHDRIGALPAGLPKGRQRAGAAPDGHQAKLRVC